MPTIAYLVHDLNDAAVARRIGMIERGGGRVWAGGFTRREPPAELGGHKTVTLGVTRDMRLGHRIKIVAKNLVHRKTAERITEGAQVLLARNLEMLLLAQAVRKPGQRVVYECLDIHRALLGRSPRASVLRFLERRLVARTDLILTSSPAFIERYFAPIQMLSCPSLIVENRVLDDELSSRWGSRRAQLTRLPDKPWRIGWFGIIRCRRSLKILSQLVKDLGGAVEVVIAGRPNYTEIPDFDAQIAAAPGIRFLGPYEADDLARLYGECHFAWTVDFFEADLNSTWLLPNRLYEGMAYGAVPIATQDVEVGRWLERNDVGFRLPDLNDLAGFFRSMTNERYNTAHDRIARLPASLLCVGTDDCEHLVRALVEPDGWRYAA